MYTLSREAVYEEEIKKSRFIVRAAPVDSPEAAFEYLDRIRDPRATHNCWAYRIGQAYRFSDDGEPGGTAGKPILSAIEHQAVDEVMVVVTRYFGGIKLGAGGLVRAYGGCAAKCLQGAARIPVVATAVVGLTVGFADMGVLYAIIDRWGAEKLTETYTAKGLEIRLRVERAVLERLTSALTDATAGRIAIAEVD